MEVKDRGGSGAEPFVIQVEEASDEERSEEEESENSKRRVKSGKAFKFLEKIKVGHGVVARILWRIVLVHLVG